MQTGARRVTVGIALALALVLIGAALIVHQRHASVTLTGVVLRQDSDPRKQLPIAGVKITAREGERSAQGESDASGLFHIKLPNGGWREQPVSLAFRHSDYQPLDISPSMNGELYVVRMQPNPIPAPVSASLHEIIIKEVRVRYSERTSSSVNVGSTAKTFTVPNIGNVACAGVAPCSPDGKWKASNGGVTIDAGEGQQFQNARVSCIAGPCPFTRIETGAIPRPGRTITVLVRNWSDTATFLVEAEVTRAMPSD